MTILNEIIREFQQVGSFTTQEAHRLGFKHGSTSAALSRGFRQQQLQRISRGVYKVIEVYYEKLLGTQHYCQGKFKSFLIVTVENNKIGRKGWLLETIEDELSSNCSEIKKVWKGYQVRLTDKRAPRWPNYEVIET